MTPRVKAAIGRLRATRGDGGLVTGTAFLVAERYLLTAFHVVGDRMATIGSQAPVCYPTLRFDPGTNDAGQSVLVVPGCWDAVDDWALLELSAPIAGVLPLPMGEVSEWELKQLPQGRYLGFESWGFPTLAQMSGSGITLDGRVQSRDSRYQDALAYELYSDQAAAALGDPFNGLSGAPCFVDGAVVGIIRSNLVAQSAHSAQPLHIVAGKLYACPIAAATLQARCAPYLPSLDPIRGLPGLPRQPLPLKPFQYLRWYEAAHAEVFFGRNRKVRELYFKVTGDDTPPVALIYGASGVGKSSLLEAGLLPRLSWNYDVHVQRREAGKTLAQSFDAQVTAIRPSGKPIIILLDQIEEVFTDPTYDGNVELVSLAERIKAVLTQAEVPLRIMLGFRSEWLANIRSRVAEAAVPFSEFYLERLSGNEIEEVVRGVESSDRLKQFYGVAVDEALPRRVADDLLADPQSPVSPVLSIILTRLWDDAKKHRAGEQQLSQAVYDDRMRNKLDLNQFLTEQIGAVAATRSEDVASGLVNDVLYRHTTEYGTAKEVSWPELCQTYDQFAQEDHGTYLRGLIDALSRQSLLFSVDRNTKPGVNQENQQVTRLAHDTLALPVRKNYEKSDLPGQRAERVLESRVEDWRPGRPDSGVLDATALAVVEQGARGMRGITNREHSFIEASRIARTKQKRLRKVLWTLAGAAVFLIVLAALILFVQARRVATQNAQLAHQVAREEMRKAQDALVRNDIAQTVPALLRVLESAPRADSIRTTAMAALINQIPRMPQLVAALGPVSAAVFAIDQRIILLRRPDGALEAWDIDRRLRLPCPEVGGKMTEFERINFLTPPSLSPDGRFVALALPVDIDVAAERRRPEKWRAVAWSIGRANLLVDRMFEDTRPTVQWGRNGLLLVHTWDPAIGEDRLNGWRLGSDALRQPFSLVSKNLFSPLEPGPDRSAIVWVVGDSGTLRYSHVTLDHLVDGQEYKKPPADAIDWTVSSPLGRAGRGFQWDAGGGGFILESQSDGIAAHCGPGGCVSPVAKPAKREEVPFPERLPAPPFTPVASVVDQDGDRLFLSSSGHLLRFPTPPSPRGSLSRYGNRDELFHPAILVRQQDRVLFVKATVSPQSVAVEATDAATQEALWKREIPWPGAHPDSWVDLAAFGNNGITLTLELAKHRLALFSTRDGDLIQHIEGQLIPFNDGANRGVAIAEEVEGVTRTRCAGPFEGFGSFSSDQRSFLIASPVGFEVHSTKGPGCDTIVQIPVTPGNVSLGIPDDWRIREAIKVVFREAREAKPVGDSAVEFLLNRGSHWHIGVDADGQTAVEAEGRRLMLPLGNWEGGYLNYVALSDDGRRMSTIDPYGDIDVARCHRIWAIGEEEKASLIAGPTCYYSSEQAGMFSPDGTQFFAVTRDGTLRVTYAGPERPQDWQWATVKIFVDLMGFVVREDGEIAANKITTENSAAAHLRELLAAEVQHGDSVARRVQDALVTWCGEQHCRSGPQQEQLAIPEK